MRDGPPCTWCGGDPCSGARPRALDIPFGADASSASIERFLQAYPSATAQNAALLS